MQGNSAIPADWEDLDCFFNEDEFAVPGSLTIKKTSTILQLSGILDTPYMKRAFGAVIIDAESPSFTCEWRAEFSDIQAGDELHVGNQEYYLQGIPEQDGTGACSMILIPEYTQDDEGDDTKPDETPTDPNPQGDDNNDDNDDLFNP